MKMDTHKTCLLFFTSSLKSASFVARSLAFTCFLALGLDMRSVFGQFVQSPCLERNCKQKLSRQFYFEHFRCGFLTWFFYCRTDQATVLGKAPVCMDTVYYCFPVCIKRLLYLQLDDEEKLSLSIYLIAIPCKSNYCHLANASWMKTHAVQNCGKVVRLFAFPPFFDGIRFR